MDIKSVLKKKAAGYTAREVVEEFTADRDDGTLTLMKRKVTKKHVPADLAALRILLGEEAEKESDEYSAMTDAALAAERERLLKELGGG